MPWAAGMSACSRRLSRAIPGCSLPQRVLPADVRLPGALEPLDKYIDQEELLRRFPEQLLSTGYHEGHYYLAPMLTSTVGILYNKNIVEAVGWDVNNLPETWDELLQFAEDVKQYAAATGQEIWPVGYSAAMEETLNMTLFP